MEIFQNPSVIISCFIVASLLSFFMGYSVAKKAKRNMKLIKKANHEMLHTLKHSISENKIPCHDIIHNLRAATCLEHQIQEQDVLSNEDMIKILSKEVMETDFISAQQKLTICEHLKHLSQKESHIPLTTSVSETNPSTTSHEETKAMPRDENLPHSVFNTQ